MSNTYEIRAARARSLMSIVVGIVVMGVLIVIAITHPFLPLRIGAGITSLVGVVFVARHVWFFRYYGRLLDRYQR